MSRSSRNRFSFLARSRYWWLDDPAEPPATEIENWRGKLQRDGRLSLSEAARIGALSDEQQERLALLLPETRVAFTPWLRFYAVLDPRQREATSTKISGDSRRPSD